MEAKRSWGLITQEQLNAYADASGDRNPIHLDDAVAKHAGLPGVIAHGMLTAAFAAEAACELAPQSAGWRLERIHYRFKAMTLLGDEVETTASVSGDLDGNLREVHVQAANQRGEVTTTAVARFVKPLH